MNFFVLDDEKLGDELRICTKLQPLLTNCNRLFTICNRLFSLPTCTMLAWLFN